MNFAAVFGASLCSGYALPACHPENGNPQRQPAELPPIKSGKLSRQSRPPLNDLIVEARILVRCCYENAFWIVGLNAEGDKFAEKMLQADVKSRQARVEFIFSGEGVELREDVKKRATQTNA